MKIVKEPVTIVCMYNKKDEIEPVRYRIKGKDGKAKTFPITKVVNVSYGMYMGDKAVTYECMTEIDGIESDCIVRFVVDEGRWELYAS